MSQNNSHCHFHKLVDDNGKWKFVCGGSRFLGSFRDPEKQLVNNHQLGYLLTLELTQMCIAIRRITESTEKPPKIPKCSMMRLLKGWLELDNSSFAFLNMGSSDEFASSLTPVCVRKSQTPFGEWQKIGLDQGTLIDSESFFVFSNNRPGSLKQSLHTVIGSDGTNWYVFDCDHAQKILRLFKKYETFFDVIVDVLPTFEYLTNMYEAITLNENIANIYRDEKTIRQLNPVRTLYRNKGTIVHNTVFFDILKELDGSRFHLIF